jgi:DNA-binding NarL/FixJ family response regulator
VTRSAGDHHGVIEPVVLETHRPHRIVVVDADHRVRASLAGLLSLGDHLEVVGQAGALADALQTCEDRDPDVVVVDPRLPDVDGGLALISVLRRRTPDCRVLVLSWADSIDHELLAIGADALLPKSLAPQELVERVIELADAPAGRPRLEVI